MRRTRILAAAVAVGLILAACSGGDDDESGSTSVPTSATVESSVATTGPAEPTPTAATTVPTATTEPPSAASCDDYTANDELPLSLCDEGVEVAGVQQQLVRAGFDVDVDGLFGPGTESAIREFQASQGLPVTGVVDGDTMTALNPQGTPSPGDPVADPAVDLAAGEVSIAGLDGNVRYQVVNTCTQRVTVGLQVTSSLLLGPSGQLRTLDFFADEGYSTIELADLNGQIVGFVFGQDGGDPDQLRWAAEPPADVTPFSAFSQIVLMPSGPSLDGRGDPVEPVSISYQPLLDDTGDLCTSMRLAPWPYADPDASGDFTGVTDLPILGRCDGYETSLVGGGGLLTTLLAENLTLVDLVLPDPDGTMRLWSVPDPADPADLEVIGGSNAVSATVKVVSSDEGTDHYLGWAELFDAPAVPCSP